MTTTWETRAGALFQGQLDQERAFTRARLGEVLADFRGELGAPRSLTVQRFVGGLLSTGVLQQAEIKPAASTKKDGAPLYKKFIRYIRSSTETTQIALSLRPGSYLSHSSAAQLHGLSHDNSKIYVNKEQSSKPAPSGGLTQAGIDLAFRNPPRTSNYVFTFNDEQIVLLAGKNTGNYGVIEGNDHLGLPIRFTSLERTLVDIAVRPAYSGGVSNVLNAYSLARNHVSVEGLLDVLVALGHVYPYHQAVGYYLQKVGFSSQELAPIRAMGLDFNFYLANGMKDPVLDRDWSIFVPADLI